MLTSHRDKAKEQLCEIYMHFIEMKLPSRFSPGLNVLSNDHSGGVLPP